MTASAWLSLLAICVLGAISPGPTLAAVMKSTVQGSKAHGLATAVAHAVAVGIYAFSVAAGIGVVITESPALFKGVTWSGAAYLVWLGIKSIRSQASLLNGTNFSSSLSLKQAAIDGFLVAFLNPKIAVFLLALFSQFVTPQTTLTTQTLMALMATLCDGIWYCTVASVAGHDKVLPFLRKKAALINRLCGGLLILVALRILII